MQDTKDVLMLSQFKWTDAYGWGTADVVSLYSSILRRKGIVTIEYYQKRYSNYSDGVKGFILEAI